MVGWYAGFLTKTGVVASVLGAEIPPIYRFANGFAKVRFQWSYFPQ